MEIFIVRKKYLSLGLAFISIIGFTFNLSYQSLPLGMILCLIYFAVVTIYNGRIYFAQERLETRIFFGFSFSLVLISIAGTITYVLYDFSDIPTVFTLLIFLVLSFFCLLWKNNSNSTESKDFSHVNSSEKHIGPISITIAFILCFLLIVSSYILLYQSRTGESLRSPWDVIPVSFFILFFLINFILIYLIRYKQTRCTTGTLLIFLVLISFLVSAIYLIVLKYPYPERGVATTVAEERKFIEFGKFIWWSGDVEKISASFFHKDLVYITGYTIISIFSKFLAVDPYFTNFFIPIMFSICLPILTYLLVIRIKPRAKKMALFASLGFLFSQHNIFILVPPTNWEILAIIFLQFSIYFWLDFIKKDEKILIPFFISLMFTIMTVLCHAYVGLYSLIVALVSIYLRYFSPFGKFPVEIKTSHKKMIMTFHRRTFIKSPKKFLGFASLLLLILLSIIPVYTVGNLLVFSPSEQVGINLEFDVGKASETIFPNIWDDTTLPIFQRSLNFLMNNFTYILYVLILFGLFLSLLFHTEYTIIIGVLILFSFSSMIIQVSLFPNIGWVREYYRFFYYMNFISFTIVGFALNKLFTITHRVNKFLGFIFVLLLASSLTTSIFAGFPRRDTMGPYGDNPKYISDYDFEAINFIKSEEKLDYPISFFIFGDSYTCSAAILEIGTPKLIKGITRFTPYSSWLLPDVWYDLLKNPSLKPFEDVMNKTGASNIYLVLSYRIAMDSTDDFNRILSSYRILLGKPIFEITGMIYVFKYQEYTQSNKVTVIVDDNQTDFWSINRIGVGLKDLQISNQNDSVNFGSDCLSLSIITGNYSYFHLFHRYSAPQNWSGNELLVFSMYGINSDNSFNIVLRSPTTDDYFTYNIVDDFIGWSNLVVPLEGFAKYGEPSLQEVREILLIFGPDWSLGSKIYLDRFILDIRVIS
jgi:hypothetical protein